MKKNQILGKTVIILIGIFITFQSFGQRIENLFSSTTRAEIGFTLEQSEKLDRMIANPIYLNHFFVKVNKLSEIQDNGNITVNLPDKEEVEIFFGKDINYKTDDEFTYFGDFDPCGDERMGYLHLIAQDGNIFGQINIEEEIYELHDFGGNKNVLFKIDPYIYTEEECASNHEFGGERNRHNKDQNINFRGGGCEVRVLVLFTAAADAVGNPQNSATLFIQQTNQIINNSEATLHFTLAGVEELIGFTETNPALMGNYAAIRDTRNRLQMNANANTLRNTHQADLVVLLTDGNWGGIFGISFLDEWGNPDFGYAISEIDAAGGRFTFTHELAHDFGCKHDNDDRGAPDFVFDARGDDFWAPWYWPTRRRTVMRRLGDGSRIMHFSNPDVKFKGKKTGEEDERENEDQLTAMGCTVSEYRPFTPPTPLTVNISGPHKGNNSGTYTWCVNIQNCDETPSILWEYSIDGINYFPWATNELCVTAPLPLDKSIFIRVTVTCGDEEVIAWHFTLNIDEDPCHPKLKLKSINDIEIISSQSFIENSFKCYPNPVENILTVDFELMAEKSQVEIQMIDLTGKIVHQLVQKEFSKGIYSQSFDISSLKTGYYFVKAKIGDDLITKSVLKK